jgi:hypothetical protein
MGHAFFNFYSLTSKLFGNSEQLQSLEVKDLIKQINDIHVTFSKEYFTGQVEKVNLSHTVQKVSMEYLYRYRLHLHESINDYLMRATIRHKYFYRVKTKESIDDKVRRFTNKIESYPVNSWMNDILGLRIILSSQQIGKISSLLEVWKAELGLKNWYFRNKDGYKGLHIYFKNKNNYYLPWELQIWDIKDVEANILSHKKLKRSFLV